MTRLIPLLCIALCLSIASKSSAITWHVPGDAPTIKAGIDSAAYGDTVSVACGDYLEYDFMMKSGVYLTSETGQADCVSIDGESQGYMFRCHNNDSNTHIVGLTVTGGRANFGGGILCTDDSPNITNCVFHGNTGVQQAGGMQFEKCSPKVTNCTVVDNQGPQGGGVYLHLANPTFENTIIAFNTGVSIYRTGTSSSASFTCSDIFGNTGGDWVAWIADQLGTAGNISTDPEFCYGNNPDRPYTLSCTSPCSPCTNVVCGRIGALAVGCSITDVEPATWGRIKVQYGNWPQR